MKKRNIDTNFQLKSRPVSASIGKFYSDKMKIKKLQLQHILQQLRV